MTRPPIERMRPAGDFFDHLGVELRNLLEVLSQLSHRMPARGKAVDFVIGSNRLKLIERLEKPALPHSRPAKFSKRFICDLLFLLRRSGEHAMSENLPERIALIQAEARERLAHRQALQRSGRHTRAREKIHEILKRALLALRDQLLSSRLREARERREARLETCPPVHHLAFPAGAVDVDGQHAHARALGLLDERVK